MGPQRQEDGEFEGNVVYMEGLVLRTMQEKKERREEGRMERKKREERRDEGSERRRKERKPWAHTYSKLW